MIKTYIEKTIPAETLLTLPTLAHQRRAMGKNGRLAEVSEVENFIGSTLQTAGAELLESIRNETGLNQAAQKAADEEARELAEKHADEGLTSEINSKEEHISLSDTLDNCVAIIERNKGRIFDDALEGGIEPEAVAVAPAPKVVLTDYARKLLAGRK